MGLTSSPRIPLRAQGDTRQQHVDDHNRIHKAFNTGVVNVKDFGALGDGTTNDTAAIQAAIDYAYDDEFAEDAGYFVWGKTVFLPMGVYIAVGLSIPPHVKILGSGPSSTAIRPPSGSTDPVMSFATVSGEKYCKVEELSFVGREAANPGQHCIYIEALPDAFNIGGLWSGTFRNLEINGFQGCSVWILSANNNGQINQFINFEKCDIVRGNHADARCVRINNQTGQITFTDCLLDGQSINQGGYNIAVSRYGVDPVGVVSPSGPYAIHFKRCTIQSASAAVLFDATFNCSLEDCYFENTEYAVLITGGRWGASVRHCSFANAASDGSGGGYAVKVTDNAKAFVENNVFAGTTDRTYVVDRTLASTALVVGGGGSGMWDDDSVEAPVGGSNTPQRANSDPLWIGPHNAVVVNGGATVIRNFTSHKYTGDRVTIMAHGGSVLFGGGGNLTNVGEPTTLPAGKYATFVRFDLAAQWALTAISP
jgi:hypothetical protein